MHGEKDILYGLSSFRLHRIPYQVLMLCPTIPPLWDNVRSPLLSKHPVIREILGSPIHVLVTNRNDRRTAKNIRTHLVESRLPAGAIVDSVLDVQTCSPLFTLMTLARELDTIELAMVMYELCGNFSIFKPSSAVEELLNSQEAMRLSASSLAWKRVSSSIPTSSGGASSLWMRQPLINIDDLRSYPDACPRMRGKSNFRKAAKLVTGITSSPFEVQLSMLLGLPEKLGGKGMGSFSNNAKITLSKAARRIYPHDYALADLFFEGDIEHRSLDIECQGAIIHSDMTNALSDNDRATALAAMEIETLGITYQQITDIGRFQTIANLIGRKTGIPIERLTDASRRNEAELRRRIMIDWATLGETPFRPLDSLGRSG